MLPHLLRRLCHILVVSACCISASATTDDAGGTWNWKIIGPLENYSGVAFARKLPAERPFDTVAHTSARGGKIRWRDVEKAVSAPIEFSEACIDRSGAYIANTFVESSSRQTVTIHASFSGTLEIYVNDSLAYTSVRDLITKESVPVANITLEKGWNRIMLKAGNYEVPFCFVALNLVDASGAIMQGLSSTTEPRLYPQRTVSPEPLTIADSLYTLGYPRDKGWGGFSKTVVPATDTLMQGNVADVIKQGQTALLLPELHRVTTMYPERYDAWFLKAHVHQLNNQNDSAIYCLQRGLELDPGAYGPAELLRRLQQKPDLFSYFRPVNADSIVRTAFSNKPQTNVQSEILLHDERILVVSGGSAVVEVDQIMRIASDADIAMFSAYQSDDIRNSLSFSLVDYKYYGDSVVAQPKGYGLVLDNVEMGDLVRIRRRYIDRDSTHIPLYYRHRHELQRTQYTRRSRFQIITPSADRFQWRSYNSMAEPQYDETPLGYRLLWDEDSLEALPNEPDMPRRDITGLIEVGTVPSWEYIAQRYNDAFTHNISVTPKVRDLMDRIAPMNSKDTLSKQEIIQRVREHVGKLGMRSEALSLPYCRSIDDIMNDAPRSSADFATMFVSMLAARDIKAHPMAIDTTTTPFHAPPTPSAVFNHVIVVVPGDSLPAFFDPTARPLASYYSLPYNVRGAFGLVIRKGLREPMYVANDGVMIRYAEDFIRIKPNEDGTASIFQSTYSTQQDSSITRNYVATAQSHATMMRTTQDSMWCETAPNKRLLKLCWSSQRGNGYMPDPADSTRLLVMPQWRSGVMYPDVPFDTIMRRTPLLRPTPLDSISSTFVVHAPAGYTFAKNQPRGIFNVESTKYSLLSVQKGDSLVVTRKIVITQPYVNPEGYPIFQVSHAKMIELDKQPIVLIPRTNSAPKRKKK
jgi:hypothetical protein